MKNFVFPFALRSLIRTFARIKNKHLIMKKNIYLLLAALFMCLGLQAAKKVQTPTHPWAGKRIAYIGDSVTDPNVKRGEMKHYWDFLSEWLESTPLVYAVNGHTLLNGLKSIDRLHTEQGDNVDGIIVFLGTNDFNASLPLGTLYQTADTEVERAAGEPRRKEYALRRNFTMTEGTVCGRINLVMHRLKTLYPTKQIVFLTPLHRGYAEFGDKNVQPDESYANQQGIFIDDVADAIIQAGRAWSIPVIDLYALSGLSPTLPEYSQYFFDAHRDCLHPNQRGHERIARTLMQQLLALPVF